MHKGVYISSDFTVAALCGIHLVTHHFHKALMLEGNYFDIKKNSRHQVFLFVLIQHPYLDVDTDKSEFNTGISYCYWRIVLRS